MHCSGRQIIEMLKKDDSDLTEDDVAHAHKVVGAWELASTKQTAG
jgi:hypothetical protein